MDWQKIATQWRRFRKYLKSKLRELEDAVTPEAEPARAPIPRR